MARQSLREQIIESALTQFSQKGYNAAGVKDITDAAGAPKGSFYNHFDSKEALAVVVLERYGSRRGLEALARPGASARARLRAHFEERRAETVEPGFVQGCLFANFGAEVGDHSQPLRACIKDALAQWTAAIAEVIRQGQADGDISAEVDADSTAKFILAAWHGTLIAARAERSKGPFNVFFEMVFGSLLG